MFVPARTTRFDSAAGSHWTPLVSVSRIDGENIVVRSANPGRRKPVTRPGVTKIGVGRSKMLEISGKGSLYAGGMKSKHPQQRGGAVSGGMNMKFGVSIGWNVSRRWKNPSRMLKNVV